MSGTTSSDVFFSATRAVNIFAVVSNLALLLPSLIAWYRGRALIAVLFFVETWFSSLYHLCKGFEVCAMQYWTLRNFDFFFATSMVWLAAVFLIRFYYPYRHWETVLNIVGLIVIAILQFQLPGEHAGVAAFSAFALALILVYMIGFVLWRYQGGHYYLLPPYNWFWLAVGASLLTLSTMLYTFQNYWLAAYWATHALWHVMAALGWTALLLSRPARIDEWRMDLQATPKGAYEFVFPVPTAGSNSIKRE